MHLQSNDKFDLTSRLQSEQHLAREINARFGEVEQELQVVKEKLHFKDEEMIRLAHENTELNKEILQLSQELDCLRHRDGTGNEKTVASLRQQLTTAKAELKRLSSKLKELERGADAEVAAEAAESKAEAVEEVVAAEVLLQSSGSPAEGTAAVDEAPTEAAAPAVAEISDTTSVCSTINMATNEAMEKLQDRFRRTMNEIADLTEEKQRLEHLVMQLQSETETIGEYIALYQTQRRLLKQRELEKDIQLHRIASDRAEMKEKLRQLNTLVELLLMQKGFTNAQQIMEKLKAANGPVRVDAAEPAEAKPDAPEAPQEVTEIKPAENGVAESRDEHIHAEQMESLAKSTDSRETAEKIISLLTEIKEKNLNQDYISVPNSIHHCPCCSGKLEIV